MGQWSDKTNSGPLRNRGHSKHHLNYPLKLRAVRTVKSVSFAGKVLATIIISFNVLFINLENCRNLKIIAGEV